jgi:hypothetical protein
MKGAFPPYPTKHSGPVLVCGPAPTLFDDFARARAVWRQAELMAISWAIRAVRAPHCVSLHYELAREFKALAKSDHAGFETIFHTQLAAHTDVRPSPGVDYFWEVANRATNSAPAAMLIADAMGFDEIVFCGVALDGSEGYAVKTQPLAMTHVWTGDRGYRESAMARENLRWLAKQVRARVYGMSGAPRDLFGAPEGNFA